MKDFLLAMENRGSERMLAINPIINPKFVVDPS